MIENRSNNITFGERLKQLRTQNGLSQTQLGKAVDTHYSQIGRYERGQAKPSAEVLKLLSDKLGVSTDYLYDGDEEDGAVADFKDKDFLRMFEEAENLPEKDKMLVKEFLDAFLTKKRLQQQFSSTS